jgi:hypothetical protein
MVVGNLGDWETASSIGWEGDDMIWSGEINNFNGQNVRVRQTITKQGPREFTDKLEVNVGGEWVLVNRNSACRR